MDSFDLPDWKINGYVQHHPLTTDEQDDLFDLFRHHRVRFHISGLPQYNACGKHTLPAARGKSFSGGMDRCPLLRWREYGAMPQTVSKPERGRASVPASPDFRRIPGKFGLAGTLALPNGQF